jgi:CelD/BcsL family acetyltransferase involved in cellulose biosynthesis
MPPPQAPLRLFQGLAGARHPDIRLWLAVHKSVVAAGAVCFDGPDHVIYWHGAANSDLFHLRPVNLLMSEIASDAARRGKTWFDLNPSGGHEGVKEFKERMGGVSAPSPVVKTPAPPPRLFFRAMGWIGRRLALTTAE